MLTQHPQEFAAAFGDNAALLLDSGWIADNNAGGHGADSNVNGLVRLRWFRVGLDRILTNPALYGPQLVKFRAGKVEGSLAAFHDHGFQLKFTLATMIGVANSYGVSGMRSKR